MLCREGWRRGSSQITKLLDFLFTSPLRGVRSILWWVYLCVCLFVRLSARISIENNIIELYQIFVCVVSGRGSVLLWRRYDKLSIWGFVDDVMLSWRHPQNYCIDSNQLWSTIKISKYTSQIMHMGRSLLYNCLVCCCFSVLFWCRRTFLSRKQYIISTVFYHYHHHVFVNVHNNLAVTICSNRLPEKQRSLICLTSIGYNILLRTQLLFNLPLTINHISLLVSNGTNCLNLFHEIRILVFISALTPISILVHPVPVTGFTQPLQTTLYMLSYIPLHFMCTHF